MTTLPLITIGITCYNAENTIARAIDSALAQDYPNMEILVVDDCSSDRSRDVVARYPAVRMVTHDCNQGVAAARNSLIDHARGEFIAFFDDDDESLPQRAVTQYRAITDYEAKTGAALVRCWASGWKQYGNGYKAYFKAIGSEPDVPVGDDVVKYQLYMGRKNSAFFGNGTPSCAMMARKSVFDVAGRYDPMMKRIEDTDFSVRLALKGGHFIGCPEQLVIQSASTGADKNPHVGLQSELALLEKYKTYFRPADKYSYAVAWAKMRFQHFSGKRGLAILTLLGMFVRFPQWTAAQFLSSVPRRLAHEFRMSR